MNRMDLISYFLSGFFIALTIVFIFLYGKAVINRKLFLSEIFRKAIIVFMLYFMVALLFGLFYWVLYVNNPNNFVYNDDVLQQKIQGLIQETQVKFNKYVENQLIGVYPKNTTQRIRFDLPNNNAGIPSEKSQILSMPKDSVYLLRFFDKKQNGLLEYNKNVLRSIARESDSILIMGKMYFVSDTISIFKDYHRYIQRARTSLQHAIAKRKDHIELDNLPLIRLDTSSIRHVLLIPFEKETLSVGDISEIPAKINEYVRLGQKYRALDAWTLFDFTYFSVQTLTGGGFGDIIPNSTIIRSVVVIETLVGIFILIVFVNAVLDPSERNKKSKKNHFKHYRALKGKKKCGIN